MRRRLSLTLFFLLIILTLTGWLSSSIALLLGFSFALFFNNPLPDLSKKSINYLLRIAIIGMGLGMFIKDTLTIGTSSLSLTALSIVLTLFIGIVLQKILKIDKTLGHLITSGTSICGGSAIAAISPIVEAKPKTISMALGTIFILNSIALFVFPTLGHYFNLSQNQFGLWCAIAIHDTSSVVGAALSFGDEALHIATTVKLSRVLWIIPLSVLSLVLYKPKEKKIKIPYFILGFIAAIFINSSALLPSEITATAVLISKRLLILTLFLVGTTLSVKDLKKTGWKPMLFALCLWVSISTFSLLYILK